ncbi:MAG: NAD(P)/FAD-dependent oxidoreductase [Candidatus Helarchaeota archaeon]
MSLDKKYDVIVVGAGPAGSVAAMKAAEGGAATLLIDKHKLPRFKLCGGGIADWIVRKLDIPCDILERKYTTISFFAPPHYKEKRFPAGMHWGVSRDRFDYCLTKKALQAGVDLLEGTRIADVIKNGTRIQGVMTDKGYKLRTDLVIACDGVYSRIARKAGLWNKWFDKNNLSWQDFQAYCIETEMALDKAIINERFGKPLESKYLFYTGREIAPLGYGWVFPKEETLTVGIGIYYRTLLKKPTEYLNYFMTHPAVAPYLKGTELLVQRGAYIPWSRYPAYTPSYMSGLLIAGDAAGMVSPISGEGIFFAIKAGLEAGKTAAEAVQKKDFSARFLAQYETRWQQSIGDNLTHQGHIFDTTLGKILQTDDPAIHLKQYREGIIEAFMRYVSYVRQKQKPKKIALEPTLLPATS